QRRAGVATLAEREITGPTLLAGPDGLCQRRTYCRSAAPLLLWSDLAASPRSRDFSDLGSTHEDQSRLHPDWADIQDLPLRGPPFPARLHLGRYRVIGLPQRRHHMFPGTESTGPT